MHWHRSADASPLSRWAFSRAHGLSMSRILLAGWSVSGLSAASSALSMRQQLAYPVEQPLWCLGQLHMPSFGRCRRSRERSGGV